MAQSLFDIEVQAFDRASGTRLPLNPKLVLRGVTWSFVERGGCEMATIPLAIPFEQTPVANGDFIEIWALNSGETVPRWRGVCNVPERSLQTSEKHTITAYGRMEDMAHVVLDKVICHPNSVENGVTQPGADLAIYASDIYQDYVARVQETTSSYVAQTISDIETTGINLTTLDATLTTARAAMDVVADQGGTNIVWGWDIHPLSGVDRFYVRVRD